MTLRGPLSLTNSISKFVPLPLVTIFSKEVDSERLATVIVFTLMFICSPPTAPLTLTVILPVLVEPQPETLALKCATWTSPDC